MNEQLTEERLAELRRVVGQMRHPTPWTTSLEWFPNRDLPGHLTTDLVQVGTHQAGADLVLDWDDRDVAEVAAKEDAVAIAVAVTWLPALVDEIDRLRATRPGAGRPGEDELARMRADAGDFREFLPRLARFMNGTVEQQVWQLSGYVLRLLEVLGVDVADEWGDDG